VHLETGIESQTRGFPSLTRNGGILQIEVTMSWTACLYRWLPALLLAAGTLCAPPAARALEMNVSTLDFVRFPEIHLYVQVKDSAGNPVTGLTDGNFEVFENGLPAIVDTRVAPLGGTSYGLALDCSGSMTGFQTQVINACTTFINLMLPLDQASIVFFENYSGTRVVQLMTNNHDLLTAAALTYYANGLTALWYGYTLALQEAQYELSPRAMVGFTDGQDNSSGSHTLQSTQLLALGIGAPVNTVGLGGVYAPPLIQIANATRGSYIQTVPDSLEYYFSKIVTAYRNQYELAYISPDTGTYGNFRSVQVRVSVPGEMLTDSVRYGSPWVSNFEPSITLTPHVQDTLLVASQPANTALTINAWITDNDVLTRIMIRHRHIGDPFYNHSVMTHVSDSLYTYTFLPGYLTSPGVEFYLQASDSYYHTTTSPLADPGQYPYRIAVLPNQAPAISHTPVASWPAGTAFPVTCTVTDSTQGVVQASLFYRNTSEIFWTEMDMAAAPGNAWTTAIPANQMVISYDMQYRIRAWDNQGTVSLTPIYQVDTGVSPVQITMTPAAAPIQIPAAGGSFDYTVGLNNSGAAAVSFDAWVMVTLPNGSPYGPVLGPLALTLPGQAALTRARTQSVPASAPAGDYLYLGHVGDAPFAPWHSDTLAFTKLSTGVGGPGVTGWHNTGESFPGGTVSSAGQIPGRFSLSLSPNPFNPRTVAKYEIREAGHVTLRVYDTAGREVRTLVNGWKEAGTHTAAFDGSGLCSGVYLMRLETGNHAEICKMVLLK